MKRKKDIVDAKVMMILTKVHAEELQISARRSMGYLY
jgi:hypothetical protein